MIILAYAPNKFPFYPISVLNTHSVVNNIDLTTSYQKDNIQPKVPKVSKEYSIKF